MTSPGRRDRRGRGRRGALVPELARRPAGTLRLPAWRSRSDRFSELVHDCVRDLHRLWAVQLGDLHVLIEDVPPAPEQRADGVVGDGASDGVALAHAQPGRIVVYRRPLELRAEDPQDLAALVHEVVVEAFADLLGLSPEEVDPDQG